MLKYDFKNNNAVVDLPSIWKIGDGKITITTASGTDAGNIPSNGVFTIQVGNVDPIRAGGTEHYGYDKNIIEVGYTSGSLSAEDRLLVDSSSVTLCQYAGENSWCRCEKSLNGLLYTALEENPTDEPRYAYFKHRTISNFTKDGDPVLSEWWVTVMQEANPDPKPQTENTTDDTYVPDTSSDNTVIIHLNLNNNSSSTVTIENVLRFLLANPDSNGVYHDTNGPFLRTDKILFSNSQVTIGVGLSVKYDIAIPADIVGRRPASNIGEWSSNVLLYVGSDSNIVTCAMMDTNYIFQNDGIYNVNITTNNSNNSGNGSGNSGSGTPSQSGTEVYTTVTIVNNSGSAKTFDGRVCFITYGSYNGYTGYFRWKGTCSGDTFAIPSGGRKTYKVTFANDNNQTPTAGASLQLTFATQALRGKFQSNNGYYINGDCYTCNDFSSTDTFRAGGIYTMTIPSNTHEWSSTSSTRSGNEGTTTNTSNSGSTNTSNNGSYDQYHTDVPVTVTITNNSGSAKTFNGKLGIIVYGTHPDPNEGYTGYIRLKVTCSGSDFTIPSGQSKTYSGVVYNTVGNGMPFAAQAQRPGYKSNIGYYNERGSCYTCVSLSSNTILRKNGTYTAVIPSNTAEWSSTGTAYV